MLRLMGGLLLLCCCTGIGLQLSGRLGARVRCLEKLERMLTDMIAMVRHQNLPTGEILSRLRQEGYLSGDASGAPEAMAELAENPLLQPEEKLLLLRVGQLLGASDRESQVGQLELEHSALGRMLEDARQEWETRGKLFRTMGLLLGTLAAVLAL